MLYPKFFNLRLTNSEKDLEFSNYILSIGNNKIQKKTVKKKLI